jgi:hypothetical protein
LFKSKAGSVLRSIPSRQFSVDAGASTSAGQSESWGKGPAVLRSSGKPGLPGRVYQRRKFRSQLSSAVWKIKSGQSKPDAGTSQIKEKVVVSSSTGDQDTSPASEELPCGGLGEQNVLQLVDRQSEELAVSGLGMDSNGSRQSGLVSTVATKDTELGGRGSVAGNGFSMALSAEAGTSSQLNVGQGSSGFGVGSVTQRQEEGSLELVIFSATEGKVGFDSEVFSRGPLEGKGFGEESGNILDSGSSLKSMVAEEGAHLLLEHNQEGLLLQDKVRDGEGKLERFEPIVVTPLAVEGVEGQLVSPRWVVERIKRYYPIIGLSCGRFEDRLMALFEEIEEARDLSLAYPKAMLSPAQGVKGQRELNRLSWSINYEKKGVQSDRGRHKGREPSRFYDA